MAIQALTQEALNSTLQQLNVNCTEPWAIDEHSKLAKSIQFGSFNEAWSFMSAIALYAEKKDHHPEWFNVYKRVDIQLTTHEAKGISHRDFEMARFIERQLERGPRRDQGE